MDALNKNSKQHEKDLEDAKATGYAEGYDEGYEDGYDAGKVNLRRYAFYDGTDKGKLAIAEEVDKEIDALDDCPKATVGKVIKWVILGTIAAFLIFTILVVAVRGIIISHNNNQIEELIERGYTYEDMVVRIEDKLDTVSYHNGKVLKLRVYDCKGRLGPFWVQVTEELYNKANVGYTITIPVYIKDGNVKIVGEVIGTEVKTE